MYDHPTASLSDAYSIVLHNNALAPQSLPRPKTLYRQVCIVSIGHLDTAPTNCPQAGR